MNAALTDSLIPVVLFIALGALAGARRWIRPESVADLSNLVFMVLTPALLFRTMSTVRLQTLDFEPVAAYFLAAGVIFTGTLLLRGFNRRAAVLGLAGTFSNTVMIGIPLVGLAYGEAGLVTLFTLVSVHSLVLLTAATVVLELAVAREAASDGSAGPTGRHRMAATVLRAVRNGIVHPVPLPILAGLVFAQTGLVIPPVLDKPLQLLGSALGPLALLLVGVTLAGSRVGTHATGALALTAVKNLLHPALVLAFGWALGLDGLPLVVMVVAASLPIGANVFLFSQRYRVAEGTITAAVAVSTAVGLVTVAGWMGWIGALR